MAPARSRVGVGIDTGGTFTDAVAVDLVSGELLSKAKAPTTRQDLAIGVREALLGLDAVLFAGVELVALSTTLATNAVVEDKGSRVGLIVAVADPATFAAPSRLPAADVAVIAGAHMPDGALRTDLDRDAARAAIERMVGTVDAFAVSAFFSVANSEHELAIKGLIAERSAAPVVCGHELSQRIGMVERAVTAALNARLLPLVEELLDAVGATLGSLGIKAPLMVVKGDGSLTAERVARDRPAETVLSGPAASVVGACRLSGLTHALVADMGGTTTDIAVVRGGMPEVNPSGALVGGWRTRVQALDVGTTGLGGDSRIRVTAEGCITVGPDRAVPLSSAAVRFPGITSALDALQAPRPRGSAPARPLFYTLVKRPRRDPSATVDAALDALDGRAVHADEAIALAGPHFDIDPLVRSGEIAEIGFTPTDALVAAGELALGDPAAAQAGLRLLALAARANAEALLGRVRAAVSDRLALAIAAHALADDAAVGSTPPEAVAVLAHLLGDDDGRLLRGTLELGVPLVAVGAPAAAWFPPAMARLKGRLVVPPHAEVANAFGALAGRVLERGMARVKAEPDETFVVITPDVREHFDDYPAAKAAAERLASGLAVKAATRAGAADASVTLSYDEVVARQARSADDVLVELTVIATASGRPYVADPAAADRAEGCA